MDTCFKVDLKLNSRSKLVYFKIGQLEAEHWYVLNYKGRLTPSSL